MTDNSQSSIIETILTHLKSNPQGVTQSSLTTAIPFQEPQIVQALNTLIENNRISLMPGPNNDEPLFKYRSEKEAQKFHLLSKEDISVYEIIMQSGTNGITANDLKAKLKIESTGLITKILKNLEKKLLIKKYKVLNTKNKKVYIGIDIEPSQEITGGVWCNNQEYDSNLVNVFSEKCFEYICKQKAVTRKELLLFAKCANLTQSELKEDDIQKILNILVFDNKIEVIYPQNLPFMMNKYKVLLGKDDNVLNTLKYQQCKTYTPKVSFDCIPCAMCPVFNECNEDNVVNVRECPYLKDFV